MSMFPIIFLTIPQITLKSLENAVTEIVGQRFCTLYCLSAPEHESKLARAAHWPSIEGRMGAVRYMHEAEKRVQMKSHCLCLCGISVKDVEPQAGTGWSAPGRQCCCWCVRLWGSSTRPSAP